MTLPDERYRALQHLPGALMDLLKPGRVRKSDLRAAVRSALRHYPTPIQIAEFAKRCPKILRK